ncbi:thiol:disulfide interchange protein [Mariniradius saccharolyticus AK6]|uniref:Thiol:disulfide interchange protein n=1 Tax=Mariniradius saccharolyticus AK6 TaxID=1239962 RepID=M7XF04_9BACT|nr:TlpA disulfide reductase family protein [Mariniradius saccharolyticus]EMS33439.1 thiol:disulfide interchange protein [Mariniradius saccharolyticus AK6]
MKIKTILIALALLAGLSVWFFYFTGKGKSIKKRARLELIGLGIVGTKNEPKTEVADFDFSGRLLDKDGNQVDISQFHGKTLFINVWASWCGPCRIEMPYIQSLYDKVKERGDIEFLMVATDKDFSKSLQFVQTKEFTFPVYHAFEGLNSSMFTKTIPVTIIVNPEGKVVYYLNGTNNFDTDHFRDFLLGVK